MEFKRITADHYRDYMKKYQIGSLSAKMMEAGRFSDEVIRELITEPELENQAGDKTLEGIRTRLLQAKNNREKVFIAGDYDTDGLCGTAILIRLFRYLGIAHGYYIPNRLHEGYGLSMERAVQAIDKGYTLFVLVDNGVKAQEVLEYCRSRGVGTIVLDHHTLEEDVPADYLFHPHLAKGKRNWLCGAGCAYEVARTFGLENHPEILMLAMTATVGDMMELRGENRWIVRKGLEILNRNPMPALRNLILKKEPPYTETDIAYQIVPKLNAVGRIAEGTETNRVAAYLASDDPVQIRELSEQLLKINRQRREWTQEMIDSIRPEELGKPFVFVYHDDFRTGIAGLAAAHISSEYNKPVLVMGRKGEEAVGSARSPEGVNVMELLQPLAHLFSAYGGHPCAAGLTFSLEHLDTVRQYLEGLRIELPETEKPAVVLDPEDLTEENLSELFSYRPFGQGVTLPYVLIDHPEILSERELGRPEYRKWTFRGGLSALSFEADKITEYSGRTEPVFIGQLDEEWFRGRRGFVLRLSKIRN